MQTDDRTFQAVLPPRRWSSLAVGCALLLAVGCADPDPAEAGLAELEQTATAASVQLVAAPLNVTAGSTYTGTLSYNATVNGHLQLRFFNPSGTKLVENTVEVAAGSGSRSISVAIPAGTPSGTGYSWNAMLFNASWGTVADHSLTGVTVGTPSTSSASTVYLSDLKEASATNGWGPFERDMANGAQAAGDGGPLRLQGVTFAKGLGVHANSDIRLTVPHGCTEFKSTIGVDDFVADRGSVVFQVFTGGTGSTKVFDSGTMTGASASGSVSVPVTGGHVLRLVVTDAGNGNASDHGDWADARLSCQTAQPLGVSGNWNLLFEDEFTGASLNTHKWAGGRTWDGSPGYEFSDSWYPLPLTSNEVEVSNGILTLKCRKGSFPNGKQVACAELNSIDTPESFKIPAGVTSFTEGRIRASDANGLLHAFWLMGNGHCGNGQCWSMTGEVDILEFANNSQDRNRPYWTVHYPWDYWDTQPIGGTGFNNTFVSHPDTHVDRPRLKNTWHTWGLYRGPALMELYIDGQKLAAFTPAYINPANGKKIADMLFTNSMHLILGIRVNDWSRGSYSLADVQAGTLEYEYVKVWRLP